MLHGEEGEAHDCWTTSEAALTQDLSEDLRDAWERLRETAASLGDQRIYASGRAIMFARRACYVFVRPKRLSTDQPDFDTACSPTLMDWIEPKHAGLRGKLDLSNCAEWRAYSSQLRTRW